MTEEQDTVGRDRELEDSGPGLPGPEVEVSGPGLPELPGSEVETFGPDPPTRTQSNLPDCPDSLAGAMVKSLKPAGSRCRC